MRDLEEKIIKIREKFNGKDGGIIQALHEVRKRYGYLHPEGLELIRVIFDSPINKILSIASFYQFFSTKPLGKYHFRICTNLTCLLHGSDRTIKKFKELTGVTGEREISKNGLFSYEEFECIGACDAPPALLLNDERYTFVTHDKIEAIIREILERESS